MNESQQTAILNWLRTGQSITPYQALISLNCFRLSARIYNLKKEGHPIKTTMITKDGKTFASYSLQKQKP
jgi:hypothetical protein